MPCEKVEWLVRIMKKIQKNWIFFAFFCDIFLVDHLIFPLAAEIASRVLLLVNIFLVDHLIFPLAAEIAFVGEYFPRIPLNISSRC